jgi:ABC-2 type transport system permease protein
MVLWEFMSLRLLIPLMVVVQLFMGAGLAIGLGLLFEDIPPIQALYLATGSSVITLLVVGMAMAPQLVAPHKVRRTFDFLWSLPVPRLTQVAASMTVWALITLPGMILALTAAAMRYNLDLRITALVIPATLLTLLVASSVGFALGHALPPMLTAMVTQVLLFVIMVFSPINFPADRLPAWLQTIHQVLPFEHAANVIRAGLTEGLAKGVGSSFAVLTLWVLGGWAVTAWVLGRRG